MKVLIIDNYDSFTYNLVYMVRALTVNAPVVKRNDRFDIGEIAAFDKIILSPGPGIPSEAGSLMQVLEHYGSQKSVLGICLGHQAIGSHFGATLMNMQQVVHGHATPVMQVIDDHLFSDVPSQFNAGRYHSWAISKENFPDHLEVLAEDANGMIMALRHRCFDVKGLQFHPESIMTEHGEKMIRNWLKS